MKIIGMHVDFRRASGPHLNFNLAAAFVDRRVPIIMLVMPPATVVVMFMVIDAHIASAGASG